MIWRREKHHKGCDVLRLLLEQFFETWVVIFDPPEIDGLLVGVLVPAEHAGGHLKFVVHAAGRKMRIPGDRVKPSADKSQFERLHSFSLTFHSAGLSMIRSEEHTSELQSQSNLVCLL